MRTCGRTNEDDKAVAVGAAPADINASNTSEFSWIENHFGNVKYTVKAIVIVDSWGKTSDYMRLTAVTGYMDM